MGMDYGALVQGIGTSVSGALNFIGNERTNQANKDIAYSNREWQGEENLRARDWQERMWQIERAYNTPAAQMERYRQAGINPFYGSKIGEGNSSSPSSPPMASAPNAPHLVSPDFSFVGDGVKQILGYMLNKESVDANSANQSAQSLKSLGEAAKVLSDVFGEEKALELMTPLFNRVRGASMDGTRYARLANAAVVKEEAEANMASIKSAIEEQFGQQRAEREIWNLDQAFVKMQSEVGLNASLAKLNDSNIEVNNAHIKELLARAYKHFADAAYSSSKALTENQMRGYFVGRLRLALADESMDFMEHFADFDEWSNVRDYKHTKSAKVARHVIWATSPDNNPVLGGTKNILSVAKEMWPTTKLQKPDMTKFIKYHRKDMTPQGRPYSMEWYDVR